MPELSSGVEKGRGTCVTQMKEGQILKLFNDVNDICSSRLKSNTSDIAGLWKLNKHNHFTSQFPEKYLWSAAHLTYKLLLRQKKRYRNFNTVSSFGGKRFNILNMIVELWSTERLRIPLESKKCYSENFLRLNFFINFVPFFISNIYVFYFNLLSKQDYCHLWSK